MRKKITDPDNLIIELTKEVFHRLSLMQELKYQ